MLLAYVPYPQCNYPEMGQNAGQIFRYSAQSVHHLGICLMQVELELVDLCLPALDRKKNR